jgi:hypothetical protein
MNTFTINQTLTKNNITYTIKLRQKDNLLISFNDQTRSLPIKTIGQFKYITINGLTLFANDFETANNIGTVKTYDFSKEEADKYKEYLLTLYP